MFLADYHTHSSCSVDGNTTMLDMARAAHRGGLSELCITDHCDLLNFQGGHTFNYDWTPYRRAAQAAQAALPPSLVLRLGLELGGAQVSPAAARSILAGAPHLDFVIGSVHNCSKAKGGIDHYFASYENRQVCLDILDDYWQCLEELAPLYDCYDVIGHIPYPLRYMNDKAGHKVSLAPSLPRLAGILRTVALGGRGIEVNTWRGQTIGAWRPILDLFRVCGGEIVTVGSDAHTPQDIGRGVTEAYDLLRETGFSHVTVFQGRVPQFIKL